MADINKIYQDISDANIEYKRAVSRNLGIVGARDRLKNLLFTHREEILSILSSQDTLQKKLDDMTECRDVLSTELESVDAENDELRKKVKQLENELEDLNDQMNHSIHELEVQIEQQEEERPVRRKNRKVMTAVVE